MHVLDMTELRKPTLQKAVISTKQPSHNAMIILSVKYHLTLQLVIHTWVLIQLVKNFTISNPINLAHLCLLDILQPRLQRTNPNIKPNTFPKKTTRQKWTGPIYLPIHIYNLLSQEAKDALQKYNVEAIQKFKASRNLNETQFTHTISEHTQDELLPIIDEEEFQECQEFNTDHDLEPP